MALFCPRCGDVLRETPEGHLRCERGDVILSAELRDRLYECYRDATRRPNDIIFTYNGKPHGVGGEWFCPGCGVRINETSPGKLICPVCSRSVVEFVYAIVEGHPHL